MPEWTAEVRQLWGRWCRGEKRGNRRTSKAGLELQELQKQQLFARSALRWLGAILVLGLARAGETKLVGWASSFGPDWLLVWLWYRSVFPANQLSVLTKEEGDRIQQPRPVDLSQSVKNSQVSKRKLSRRISQRSQVLKLHNAGQGSHSQSQGPQNDQSLREPGCRHGQHVRFERGPGENQHEHASDGLLRQLYAAYKARQHFEEQQTCTPLNSAASQNNRTAVWQATWFLQRTG